MTTAELYRQFVKNNTRCGNMIDANANYKNTFGSITFEQAFDIYLNNIKGYVELKSMINNFEQHLISLGINAIQSNISESRYYYYNGIKYRFSNHVYPTGTMTNAEKTVIDFAANPELINEVTF